MEFGNGNGNGGGGGDGRKESESGLYAVPGSWELEAGNRKVAVGAGCRRGGDLRGTNPGRYSSFRYGHLVTWTLYSWPGKAGEKGEPGTALRPSPRYLPWFHCNLAHFPSSICFSVSLLLVCPDGFSPKPLTTSVGIGIGHYMEQTTGSSPESGYLPRI